MVFDPIEHMFYYLILGTRGGPTRLTILDALHNPQNTNQLATLLKLDYKTVIHHLDLLRKNHLIHSQEHKKYGERFELSNGVSELIKKVRKDSGKG